ncbi:MAG: ATP-binding protein [Thiovulaceae bacterium]|nr:ATP-binding protein [Sulfurimonadaceae bacterium]
MKTFNLYYRSKDELKSFLNENNIVDSQSLLIQVFTSKNDEEFIASLCSTINTLLPSSSLIGATTDGEIKDGIVSTMETVISFSIFEKTSLKTYISLVYEDYFSAGVNLAKDLNTNDTKVIIAFTEGLNSNGDDFLKGIDSVNSKLIVAGGMAGDNGEFKKTFVFNKEKVLQNAVVGVALSSNSLNIFNHYSFNWLPIGLDLKITRAEGNRVYTINDKTAYEIYAYYLGEETAKALPDIAIEFPLIIQRNGSNIARAALSSESDGSLIFAGNFKDGDTVRFGYGDSSAILENSKQDFYNVVKNPIESIFIYSCMARRRFMPELIQNEVELYKQVAPTSGFYTYGEFYTTKNKELLNQSMTLLALSESDNIHKDIDFKTSEKDAHKSNSVRTLAHLVKTTSQEFEILNIMLENKVQDEIEKNREKTKEIIEQKQLFETVFNKSSDGFLIIEDGKVIDCNDSVVKMLKYESKQKFLNTPVSELTPEYQPDGELSSSKSKENVQKARINNSHTFEWVVKQSDGKSLWVDVTLNNISNNSKQMFFGVWKDINEKKKTEFELEELTKNLEQRVKEQVNELREKDEILFKQEKERIELKYAEEQAKLSNIAKSNFLANMSHEIRTPLNAILGFIDILFKEEESEEKRKKLKIIKDSSDALLTIINDILDFSKIESGKLAVDKIVFNTKEPFSTISSLFYEKAQEKNIKINLVFDKNLPTKAYGDITRIKQVYSNLVSNAIKFSNQDSNIDVKIFCDETTMQFMCSVEDYGVGIASENIYKIFHSFEQADNSTTRKFGGTGLGLSISKRLIELMDGSLEVESKLGEGSKFYFTLDLFSDIPNIPEKSELVYSAVDKDKLNGKILLVEDNKTNQILIELMLEEFGLEVDTVNDGSEAIEAYKNNIYSLILMDENMPVMSGLEATKIIRELESTKSYKTPIVAVTANALSGERERFITSGMDDYISKPIVQGEFERVLVKYLYTPQS